MSIIDFIDLTSLGWNDFFKNQLTLYDKNKLIARVISRKGKIFELITENGYIKSEIKRKIIHDAVEKNDFPVVGDWVLCEFLELENKAIIYKRLKRKTSFSRKFKGDAQEKHVIAANLDTIFYVAGLDNDYNPRKIERFLLLAQKSKAQPIIILNKKDLCTNIEEIQKEIKEISIDVPFIFSCATNGLNIENIKQYLSPGKTVAFIGSSGTGKSTIINSILGIEKQKTQDVRNDSKGRHTTTHRELILTDDLGMIIDTPGMRELQLWADEDNIEKAFSDITELAKGCKFRNCSHQSEPDCNVRRAVDNGELGIERLNNFIKMREEIEDLNKKQLMKKKINHKAKIKKILKHNKKSSKKKKKKY